MQDITKRTHPAPSKSARAPLTTLANKVTTLVAELRKIDRPLPALYPTSSDISDDERAAAIDYVAVANLVRHNNGRDLKEPAIRKILIAAARDVGLAYHADGPPTFVDLEAEMARQSLPARAINGIVELRKILALPSTTRLDTVFSPASVEALEAAWLRDANSVYEIGRRRAAFRRILKIAYTLIADRAMPMSFGACLRELISREGMSIDEVARRSEVNPATIRSWLVGAQPRHSNLPEIDRVAATLSVDPAIFRSRIAPAIVRVPTDEIITATVRSDFESADIPLEFLLGGDLEAFPMRRRVEWVYDNVIAQTPYTRYVRAGLETPVQYVGFSAQMEIEWAAIVDFKTSQNPDPTLPRTMRIPLGNGLEKTLGGHWRTVSADLARSYVERMLAALVRRCRDAGHDDAWVATAGLGFLAFPQCHKIAADMIAIRRYKLLKAADFFQRANVAEPPNGMVFAYPDINRLYIIAGLLNSETGFLHHNPPKLSAIPGIVSAAQAAAAETNWNETIGRTRTAIANMIRNFWQCAVKVRDPAEPIRGLIELEQPMEPLYDALERMAENRPTPFGDLVPMATHDRNLLLNCLIVHTKMRRSNYGRLTWKADNTGHLQCVIGPNGVRWRLVIPRGELKNAHTSAVEGKESLVIELDPEDPVLYQAIENWIGRLQPDGSIDETGSSRMLRYGAKRGDYLFPGMIREHGGSEGTTNDCFRALTALYVADRPWIGKGVKDVMPFGVHAIRDLAVTHILAMGGSYADAAQAIWDTEATVRKRYSHLSNLAKSRQNYRWFRRKTTTTDLPHLDEDRRP